MLAIALDRIAAFNKAHPWIDIARRQCAAYPNVSFEVRDLLSAPGTGRSGGQCDGRPDASPTAGTTR